MMAAVSLNKKSSHGRDSRPFTFYPHSYSSKPTKGKNYIGDTIKQTLGVYTGLHVDNTYWSHWRLYIVKDLTVGVLAEEYWN